MGDAGRLYVAADVIPMYKSMLPLSTIITPNWFEVEYVRLFKLCHSFLQLFFSCSFPSFHLFSSKCWTNFQPRTLTGVRLTSASSLRQALTILHHEHHVPNVVISSMPYGAAGWAGFPASARPSLIPDVNELVTCLCSTSASASEHAKDSKSTDLIIHVRAVKLIPGYFSGVGDLFSAMVLAHFQPSFSSAPADGNSTSTPPSANLFDQSITGQTPLSLAVSSALAKTHAVLTRTQTHFTSLPADEQTSTDEELDAADPERKVTRMRARELRLVQSQDIIRDPALGREGMILWEGFDSME
jgi:pyridoxine kinase